MIINYFKFSWLSLELVDFVLIYLFDWILYVPVNNFSIKLGRSSWFEPVLSKD